MSVLLPCFDAAATLNEALESLWRQSFADFEVVAVDDGSTDETAELLEEARRADDRLTVFRTPHRGIAATLGYAAARAKGSLLARMDADDRAHAERLRLQVEHLRRRPDVSVSSSRVRLFPADGLKDGYRRYLAWLNGILTHEDIRRNMFVESPLPHPSVLMRREALDSVGGYRVNGWPEDYDLWMRLLFDGHRFEKLEEVLLDWRESATRASRVDPAFSSERFLDVKFHYLANHLEPGRAVTVWGAGPVGKRWGRRVKARYYIELDPRKIGQSIGGATVLSPEDLGRVGDGGCFVVVAVAALSRKRDDGAPWRSARDDIREKLTAAGFAELRDFLCVA